MPSKNSRRAPTPTSSSQLHQEFLANINLGALDLLNEFEVFLFELEIFLFHRSAFEVVRLYNFLYFL